MLKTRPIIGSHHTMNGLAGNSLISFYRNVCRYGMAILYTNACNTVIMLIMTIIIIVVVLFMPV